MSIPFKCKSYICGRTSRGLYHSVEKVGVVISQSESWRNGCNPNCKVFKLPLFNASGFQFRTHFKSVDRHIIEQMEFKFYSRVGKSSQKHYFIITFTYLNYIQIKLGVLFPFQVTKQSLCTFPSAKFSDLRVFYYC